jgi:hypothetical protein
MKRSLTSLGTLLALLVVLLGLSVPPAQASSS